MNQQPTRPAQAPQAARLAPLPSGAPRPVAPAGAVPPQPKDIVAPSQTVLLRRSALLRRRGELMRVVGVRPDLVIDILHELAAEINVTTGGWLLGSEHVAAQMEAWGVPEVIPNVQNVWNARKELI